MTTTGGATVRMIPGLLLALAIGGCDGFLTVNNPTVIAASEIDPAKDAGTFSRSALQNLANAFGYVAVQGSYVTWETWPAETAPELNLYGQRAVTDRSFYLADLWSRVSLAITSGDKVGAILEGTAGAESNLDLARGVFGSGYALELMAETFCGGVISGGPELSTEQVLDEAISRLERAATVAGAAAQVSAGSAQVEANQIVGAAHVGIARAHLQAGRKAEAAAEAALVPPGFRYDLLYADVPSARDRLGNQAWINTFVRAAIVVPPAFRTGDPRVPFVTPTPDQFAIDGITPFFAQAKFQSFDAPVRLASKLEADYIAAEATGPAAMLALIASERAAHGLPAYSGGTDAASVLGELMLQRSLEFYLEGKRLGDFRRNGAAVPFVPAPGSEYFKPGFSAIGDLTCLPIPFAETSTNPNFPHS